jgi:acyl carrier protein
VILEEVGTKPSALTESTRLSDFADIDLLDVVSVIIACEKEFGIEIPDDRAGHVTLGEVVELARRKERGE